MPLHQFLWQYVPGSNSCVAAWAATRFANLKQCQGTTLLRIMNETR